ncbi:ras-related and estrogen-regulated growth inhibitor-like protein [Ciona intestinalis]
MFSLNLLRVGSSAETNQKNEKGERTVTNSRLSEPIRKKILTHARELLGNSSKPKPINILFAGAHNVGKTAVLVRFLTKRYIGEYISGEDMTYDYNFAISNKNTLPVVFRDTSCPLVSGSAQVTFEGENLDRANGIVVVYDVGDATSFQFANDFISSVKTLKSDACAKSTSSSSKHKKSILLLGNKRDLECRRCIHTSMGRDSAKLHSVLFDEVSAAEGTDEIVDCMNDYIRVVSNLRPPESKKRVLRSFSQPI